MAPIWCDIARARALTDAKYTDEVLNSLGEDAEDDIRAELSLNGLEINPSPPPLSLVQAAKYWLLRNIRVKQKHDGTHPSMLVLGSTTETISIDQSITDYDSKGRRALDRHIDGQTVDDECLVRIEGDD